MPSATLAARAATLQQIQSIPDIAEVGVDVVCALLDCHRTTAWRMVQSGELCRPVRRGRWRLGDLRQALASPQKNNAA